MKAGISNDGYRAGKRYSSVRLQQGRVLIDRDWNEQADVTQARHEQAMDDAIADGTPLAGGLLAITEGPGGAVDMAFRPEGGRVYAEGVAGDALPADPAQPFAYANQLDFPDRPPQPAAAHWLYVDVWERSVIVLEDPNLTDAALHGADTCFRGQTMAQVKWCPDPGAGEPAFRDPERNPAIGDAAMTLALRRDSVEPDPCDPCADEVDLGGVIGNYLFRLEVHHLERGGDGAITLVLKWSSENAATAHPVGAAPDSFKSGGWIYEYHDDTSERHLGNHLNDDAWTPRRGTLLDAYRDDPPDPAQRYVRRWDGCCTLRRAPAGGWSLVSDPADPARPGSDRGDRAVHRAGLGGPRAGRLRGRRRRHQPERPDADAGAGGPPGRRATTSGPSDDGRNHLLVLSSEDGSVKNRFTLAGADTSQVEMLPGDASRALVLVDGVGLFFHDLDSGAGRQVLKAPTRTAMAVSRDGSALAAVFDTGEGDGLITQVRGRRAQIQVAPFVPTALALYPLKGGDDVPGREVLHLAVLGKKDAKSDVNELRVYDAATLKGPLAAIDLGPGEADLALAGDGDRLYVSRGLEGQVSGLWWADTAGGVERDFDNARYLPLQVGPRAIDWGGGSVFAVNARSVSVLRVPDKLVARIDDAEAARRYREAMEPYRDEVQLRFRRAVQLFASVLRDCICRQLLPDCPADCGEPPHKVPLACLSVADGAVERICNIGHRKFVVTFPTLFHWLSLVPLVPLLGWLVERFCCGDWLDDLFEQENLGQMAFDGGLAAPGFSAERLGEQLGRAGLSKAAFGFAGERALRVVADLAAAQTRAPGDFKTDLAGQRAEQVAAELRGRGVAVARRVDLVRDAALAERLRPGLSEVALAPLKLRPGTRVTLFERDGRVAYYTVETDREPAAPDDGLADLDDRLDRLEKRKAALADLSEVRAALDKAAARKAAVADLSGVEDQLGRLSDAQARFAALKRDTDALRQSLAGLESRKEGLADLARIEESLARVESAKATLDALVNESADTAARMGEMRREVKGLSRDLDDLGKRRDQLADFRDTRRALESLAAERQEVEKLDGLRREIRELSQTRDRMLRDADQLKGTLQELERERQRLRTALRRDFPVDSVADAEAAKRLRELGVPTVGDLADADPRKLAQRGTAIATLAQARKLVAEAARFLKSE